MDTILSWNELENPWQVCFELGWTSFKRGSIPIGAVVVDDRGEIIAQGRSLQYEIEGEPGEVKRHKLSHAELNALLKVSEFDYPNIREFTLYTTTEPCPLCFGALVMANVRNLMFAARDRYAGSTELNQKSDYIASKNIRITGPFKDLETIQITIHVAYEMLRGVNTDKLLNAWQSDNPTAVKCGVKLFKEKILDALKEKGALAAEVYETVRSLHSSTLRCEW